MIIIRNKRNIINGLILLFAIFPIIPNSLKGLPVILLFIASIFFFDKRSINWKELILNSSLFLIYLLSLTHTQDYSLSLRKLETSLSVLAIPLIFFVFLNTFHFSIKIKEIFIKTFIISSCLFSLYTVVFINIIKPVKDYVWLTDKYRATVSEMPLLSQHPIYASIFLFLGLLFFFYLLKNQYFKGLAERVFFFTLTLINFIVLIVLSSKAVILTVFLILFFFFLLSIKNRFRGFLTIVTFIFIVIALFTYNRRMGELVDFESYQNFDPKISTSIRMAIYSCSFEVIKRSPLLGYGIGGAQRQLNLCYANKSDVLLFNSYNTHNQYLDAAVKAGMLGLFVFSLFLFTILINAIRNKDQLLTFIIVFYSILFFTENILSRQSGVILFFFLICFFNKLRVNSKLNDSKFENI